MEKVRYVFSKYFYLFAVITFFIATADAYMSYFVPIVITDKGFSATQMGILYSLSCVFGAFFDVILSKILHNTNYKRMYFYTIVLATSFPFLLFTHSILWLYVIAMATWGLYLNIFSFGLYDFVAREEKEHNHANSFGVLYVFKNAGLILGPLLGTQSVILLQRNGQMIVPILFSSTALILLIFLVVKSKSRLPVEEVITPKPKVEKPISIALWIRIATRMWPVLLLVLFLSIIDGIFWTVAPIIGKIAPQFENLNAFLLIVSIIPAMLITRLVRVLTARFGKKRTAYMSFLISNILLLPIGFTNNVFIVLALVFISMTFSSLVFPSIAGVVADFLKESEKYDGQILTSRDFSANIGYGLGAFFAGILIDLLGSLLVFTTVAAVGIIVSIILLIFSPKEIDFHDIKIEA